jgi:arylsulfatase A-like enzyme
MSRQPVSLAGHVILAMFAALLAGLLEGGIAAAASGEPLALPATILALMVIAAPLGLFQGVLVRAGYRGAGKAGLPAWLRARTTNDREAPREPVIGFHARALGTVGGFAAGLLALWLGLLMLENVADPSLRRALSTAVAGGAGVAGLFVAFVMAWLLVGPLRKVDSSIGLPFPKSASLRYLIFVAIPATAILLPLALTFRAGLGLIVLPLWLLLLIMGEGLVVTLWRDLGTKGAIRPSVSWRGAAISFASILITCVLFFELWPTASWHLHQSGLARQAVAFLRHASDVDRDGASALFGGADCAGFNAVIGPYAEDVPANGVDENCDGQDAKRLTTEHDVKEWQPTGSAEIAGVEPRHYNIVWVISDAVRADHAQFLGYEKATTPYLTEVSKESMIFEQAYTQSSSTMLSMASMFVGQRPGAMTWETKNDRLHPASEHLLLQERLAELGYRTGVVTDGYSASRLRGMYRGFHDLMSTGWDRKRPKQERNRVASVVVTKGIQWLERDRGLGSERAQPFFLLLYMPDPHNPYAEHDEGFPSFGRDALGRYDSEIAFTDRYLGFLIDYLKHRSLWDEDTILIFSADHGEEFGEHGGEAHAQTCYEESIHVPLLIRIPGLEPKQVPQRVSLVDVAPTILDALGEEPGEMKLEGRSTVAVAFGDSLSERPAFCSLMGQNRKRGEIFIRSVMYGDHHLIYDMLEGSYELYNVRLDPMEKTDLIDQSAAADTAVRLKELLGRSLTGNLFDERLIR